MCAMVDVVKVKERKKASYKSDDNCQIEKIWVNTPRMGAFLEKKELARIQTPEELEALIFQRSLQK